MNTKISQNSYQSQLVLAGLNSEQALIYEILLQNGPLPASKIHQKTPYKRGLVYKVLNSMAESGIIIKRSDLAKITYFEPAHPLILQQIAEKKEDQAKNAQLILKGILDPLTSSYNLVVGKPGVQFFEGYDGMKTVIYDNLTAKTEILAYLDMSIIDKYIPEINQKYVESRKRLKIKKRNLVSDTPENRERLKNYFTDITEVRFMELGQTTSHFSSMMQIYDNKISYITLDPKRMIGVIIDDPNIAEMHRQLYLYTWKTARPLENAMYQ